MSKSRKGPNQPDDTPAGAKGRRAPSPDELEASTSRSKDDGGDDKAIEPEVLDADRTPAKKPKLPMRSGSRPSGRGDLLQTYLSEIRRHPLLDPEEEKEIAIKYMETQDPEAAARLVTANLRLVVKLAFQYHRQWANVLDLIQEGNTGLVEALSRYDPYRGIRFSSYAQYWIRAMILRFLMDNYRIVRLGSTRHGRKLFFQLQKEKERLSRMGITPSTKALSEALNIPETEIVNVDRHLSAPALSLHAPVGGEEGRELAEVIASPDQLTPETEAAEDELGAKVRDELETFAHTLRDEREVAIWYERLVAEDSISLAKLGERFGVSKERVRQIEARVKKRLKLHLQKGLGEEIDFEFNVPQD